MGTATTDAGAFDCSKLNGYRGGAPSIIALKDHSGILIGYRDIILEYVKPSDETIKLVDAL